jgi:GGDEF domain-containing protein
MSLSVTLTLALRLLRKFALAGAAALLLLVSMASSNAWSRSVLDLVLQQEPVALKDWGDYWIDGSGKLTATQITADTGIHWKPTQAAMIYPVTSGQALWVRFSVPPAPDTERWYLEVPYPAINRVTLFSLDTLGHWDEQASAGDMVAVSKWPVPNLHPFLPIAVSAEVPQHYLLRLESDHSFGVPFQFLSESELNSAGQQVSLVLGIFFGLMGLTAVISAISALSLRDPAFGFYTVAVMLTGLTEAAATGIAGLHLWPNSPVWNDASRVVLPVLQLIANLMFISAVVSLPERSARLYRLVIGVAVLGLVTAVAVTQVSLEWRIQVLLSYIFLPQLLGFAVLAWAWRLGDRFAPWLMLGFAPVVLTEALTVASSVGGVPGSFFFTHAPQFGVAIELPIVLVILMLRSQQQRENRRRILGLDRVDPSTGLINGHVFAQRLVRMIARSGRFKQQSAVIVIDIVNTDQIERDYGHKTAEELPLRVAERLLSTARDIDSAARLSERRFGMLVEGPFDAEGAGALGPRIVARCMMPYKGLHIDCVAQVRVAYALVPHQSAGAQSLLTRLEERLATAAAVGDKRAVFMLTDTYKPA